jgi:lysophospholipase L1-like esterase
VGSLLLASGASVLAAAGDGTLSDPNLRFVGRWEKSATGAYTSNWGGAYLSAKFTGTKIDVNLGAPINFQYILDGKPQAFWQWKNDTTVTLSADSSISGPHTLQIVSNWESNKLSIVSLTPQAGQKTLPLDPRPLIEFIGDSITAGHGTTNGALKDYAWLVGEKLGMDHTQIAVSGITLTNGYFHPGGPYPGMDNLYFKTRAPVDCPPQDTACANNPPWNFSAYSPKLIVVNLGTNDAILETGAVPKDVFQTRYTNFLAALRARHPNAEIAALGTFRGYYLPETEAAVNARVSAGDTKVHFIKTVDWITSSDTVDGLHPSDAGHVKITGLLVPELQKYLTSTTTVNDTQFSYDNAANWAYGAQPGANQSDNHWSNVRDAYYQLQFTGTQAKVYGGRAPMHGIAAISVDGGAETSVDTYAATRADNVLLWSSPTLGAGTHTLKVRVTGSRNPSAWNNYISADRVDIVGGDLVGAQNLLSNASFENGLNGWYSWPGGAWQYADKTSPHSGSSHLTHGSATPYAGATFQQLTGLSNGLYTVKAWVRGTGGQWLYVKDHGGSQMQTKLPASDVYTQVTISDINVTNGQAQIGFWSEGPGSSVWLNVDDVSFTKQ